VRAVEVEKVLPRVGLVAGAGLFLVIGLWAFFWPSEFFDTVADYPPYNEHFIHDIGAFNIGLGVLFLGALAGMGGVAVALTGGAVGSVFHALAHFMDKDQGGRDTDPWSLGLFALLLVVAAVVANRRGEAPREG
jgi:hypothetical protein